jgi:hypothetical protein
MAIRSQELDERVQSCPMIIASQEVYIIQEAKKSVYGTPDAERDLQSTERRMVRSGRGDADEVQW